MSSRGGRGLVYRIDHRRNAASSCRRSGVILRSRTFRSGWLHPPSIPTGSRCDHARRRPPAMTARPSPQRTDGGSVMEKATSSSSELATTTIGAELEVSRIGYGAMQLTGDQVWGDYPDRDGAIALLRASSRAASRSSTPPTCMARTATRSSSTTRCIPTLTSS
jgi:hypothetical protein